jgi:EpsI family protein
VALARENERGIPMNPTRNSWLRFLVAVALLVGAGAFLQKRSHPESVPPHAALSSFPSIIGHWTGRDVDIPPEFLAVLGPGDFLSRIYRSAAAEPYIDFFIAYFPSQRTGDTIHSPKNCLPGAGWAPIESARTWIERPVGPPIEANRYVLEKADSHMLALYWYQSHGRAVASEYWAKYYLVADSIHLNRTDGALVRVITPVASGESVDAAEKRAVSFSQKLLPVLDRYIPD